MPSAVPRTQVEGFIVPDARIAEGTVAAQGAGATDSDFTQAGARAGAAVPDQDTALDLEASGAQTDKGQIEIVTLRAGPPGPDAGGFGFRDVAAGDSATQIQGWDGYQVVTGMTSLWRGAVGAGGSHVDAVRLRSGKVLAAYQTAISVAAAVTIDEYDPGTGAWTGGAVALAGEAAVSQPCPCLVELVPEQRLLLFVESRSGRNLDCYYSDDPPGNWTAGARSVLSEPLPVGCTINEIRAAYNSDQIALAIQYTSAAPAEEIAQYASTHRGTRFDQVDADWSFAGDFPDSCSLTALQGGGFLLVYSDGDSVAADTRYKSRRIGSAFEDFEVADVVELSALPVTAGRPSCAVWEDEDGIVYAICAHDEGAASYLASIYRSLDRGDSWERWGGPLAELNPAAQNVELNEFAAVSTGGLGLLISRYTGNGDAQDNSAIIALHLGGHGNITVPLTDEDVDGVSLASAKDTGYICWSESDDNSKFGGLYLSVEEPQNTGWTGVGAGVETITAGQLLEVTTSGNARSYRRQSTDTSLTSAMVEFWIDVETGDGDETAKDISVDLTLSDYDGSPASATKTYIVSGRFAFDKFRIYDDNGPANLGEVTIDLTTPLLVRIAMDIDGNVKTFYSRGGQRKQWTAGPSSAALTNTTADTPNAVEFGNISAPGAQTISRWTHVGFSFWGFRWGPRSTDTIAAAWTNPVDLHARSFPVRPCLVHDGVRIAARSGPAFLGETWQIRPRCDYGIESIFPGGSPSPRKVWRSVADGAVESIVFDLDADFAEALAMSTGVGAFLLRSNLETAVLEGHDGAVWQTILSLDSTDGWAGLDYARRGRTLYPSNVATPGEKHLFYGVHVGDTFDLNKGGADDLHRIAKQTEGDWQTDVTGKRPRLVLGDDNMPGALGDTGTGAGKLRRRDFGGVAFDLAFADYTPWRLRIPAQSTADGYYQIGTLVIGHLVAFAHGNDRGWSIIHEPNAEIVERRSGSRRGRKHGPARRVVEISWAETAVDSQQAQKASPAADYVLGQTSTALPIGTPSDTLQTVMGAVEETDGPVLPVVFVRAVPTDTSAGHRLTDHSDFVYGRITSSPRLSNVTGAENASELNRMETVTIEEEV